MRNCHWCAEQIKGGATVCRYCGQSLGKTGEFQSSAPAEVGTGTIRSTGLSQLSCPATASTRRVRNVRADLLGIAVSTGMAVVLVVVLAIAVVDALVAHYATILILGGLLALGETVHLLADLRERRRTRPPRCERTSRWRMKLEATMNVTRGQSRIVLLLAGLAGACGGILGLGVVVNSNAVLSEPTLLLLYKVVAWLVGASLGFVGALLMLRWLRGKVVTLKKHQLAAIIIGAILSVVSFFPVLLVYSRCAAYHHNVFRVLGDPDNVQVFLCPTIGVGIAAAIVFISFLKTDKG